MYYLPRDVIAAILAKVEIWLIVGTKWASSLYLQEELQ